MAVKRLIYKVKRGRIGDEPRNNNWTKKGDAMPSDDSEIFDFDFEIGCPIRFGDRPKESWKIGQFTAISIGDDEEGIAKSLKINIVAVPKDEMGYGHTPSRTLTFFTARISVHYQSRHFAIFFFDEDSGMQRTLAFIYKKGSDDVELLHTALVGSNYN